MAGSWEVELIRRHRRGAVILDTNLLLLYLIGLLDCNSIGRFKRTAHYSEGDFRIVENIVRYIERNITTPNCITEASNLLGSLGEPMRTAIYGLMRERLTILEERYVPSVAACNEPDVAAIGVADAALAVLGRAQVLVVTDDLKLVVRLEQRGVGVLNLNRLRSVQWFGL